MRSKILLVDDDPFTRRLFENLLRDGSVELVTTTNVADARDAFNACDFNLVILDQRLPDGDGLELFAQMRELRPRQTALMITGYAEARDAMRAVREGLFDYLTKPFENLEELEVVITKALEMDRAYREIADLREIFTSTQPIPYREAHLRFERTYFSNLLLHADGNVSEASRLSGIARQNIYGHLERAGLFSKR
ncbi:MAG: response regulator [Ramlibacter sp.]|nr:response regulator [Ramlibacter sp.]